MHILIVGGSRADRLRAAAAREHDFAAAARLPLETTTLPFVRPDAAQLPSAQPRILRIDDLERAFPNNQASGTRLVLTQSTYLLQKWIDRLGPDDIIIATANPTALERTAPEAFHRRGPWRLFETLTAEHVEPADSNSNKSSAISASSAVDLLARAFQSAAAEERVALCRRAVDADPDSDMAALALASALREMQDLEGAHNALDRAVALAPDWEAAHFEAGKFWLACDEMERARDAFQRAADLMPTFSAAFSNLGATLGELDDPEGAAAAFDRALKNDPDSFTILNNIGVVNRELGRLDVSEAALTRVTQLAPGFVFGHYNLGHTRFLSGNYAAALAAYEEGQRRDPEKNRRQGCRLAIVRFATGDVAGAERDFWRMVNCAPADEREDLLLEAYEIGRALLEAHPALASHRQFLERIAAEL